MLRRPRAAKHGSCWRANSVSDELQRDNGRSAQGVKLIL